MASRNSAARPSKDGELFARTHHHDADESDPKRVKFDARNPSKLAPDAREDDAILDADVIGGGTGTKRGAVNLDGYDSDSDGETFNAKAERRRKGDVDILAQLDNYDAKDVGLSGKKASTAADDKEEDDDDMFAEEDDDGDEGAAEPGISTDFDKMGKKIKNVSFLDENKIQGQDYRSKTGGHIRVDDEESSEDEDETGLREEEEEEGIDQEVGLGGLKKNAPKVEAFNLKEEMEEGQFDESGNYIRKGGDPDAVHDSWLQGMSKKDMKKAAEAHEKREAEARARRIEEDEILVSDLLKTLILCLEKAETPLEALARLGKEQPKVKKIPQWKLKKMNQASNGQKPEGETTDPALARIKESISSITDAADRLLSRDYEEIYDQEREMLIREYQKESGETWTEPKSGTAEGDDSDAEDSPSHQGEMWEFRWTDKRDGGATQGPFDVPTMKAWQDAGYFSGSVEFRPIGQEEWSLVAGFA